MDEEYRVWPDEISRDAEERDGFRPARDSLQLEKELQSATGDGVVAADSENVDKTGEIKPVIAKITDQITEITT